jgi:TetR/AcrR family transcriptional regulator, transcriptional repressor for nem operon
MARPREFDEEQVLEAVADAFWAKGYEGTSTRDLVNVTGLTQPSLYNAFGDKRALFRRALEFYLDRTLRERLSRIESALPPVAAIEAFFKEVIKRSVSDRQQRGCMMVNSALEATSDDMEFRKALGHEFEQLRAFFRRCVTAAQQNGEIPSTIAPEDAASHLLTVLLGMRVLARINPKRAVLRGAAAGALACLDLPAPRGR